MLPQQDWRQELSQDQVVAASHLGSHARLLAGPGTGKTRTLTRRILYLVLEAGVQPEAILAITFTRMAAFQLREEIRNVLAPLGLNQPRVSTLHSFALRQLMRNAPIMANLPTPLLIADDWEERNIIQEDLKTALNLNRIREVQALLNHLSAGFETLRHGEIEAGHIQFPNPQFLGAWATHRRIYGYTLRSELVYQLKQGLERYPEFQLEAEFRHLLVDEYQDLNACDLSIINRLADRGLELFVAGDDDQSIYGFRFADPTGIREFIDHFPGSAALSLEICYRCDRNVLEIAEFVANQDVHRLEKPTRPRDGAEDGLVEFHSYRDQHQEALGVAEICQNLIRAGSQPDSILVLMRSDLRGVISQPIVAALHTAGLITAERLEQTPLDSYIGRIFLSYLRLVGNREDSFAWRSIFQLENNGIGDITIERINDFANRRETTFARALFLIRNDATLFAPRGEAILNLVLQTEAHLNQFAQDELEIEELLDLLANDLIGNEEERNSILGFLLPIVQTLTDPSIAGLITSINTSLTLGEQEVTPNAINIMTMHKAKGLSADNVIIVGVEDQFIPGRNQGDREGDERRLLYVSMTRARHRLYIAYCRSRIEEQRFTG